MQHIIESLCLQTQNINIVIKEMFPLPSVHSYSDVYFDSLFVAQDLDREPSPLWRH